MTTHIDIPYEVGATRAELAELEDTGWCLSLIRPYEPRELHAYTRNMVGDGIPGGDSKLADTTAVIAYFESRLQAAGYDPQTANTIGQDLAAWDLLKS